MKQKNISDDKKICKTFNDFFSNVVSDLEIPAYCNYFPQKNTHTLSTTIETFEKHPSILNIKKETWFSIFIQKDYWGRGVESYPGFKR